MLNRRNPFVSQRAGVAASRIAASVLVVCTSACAGMQDVVESQHEGEGRAAVYSVTQEQAREIGSTVFRWAGADTIEEHRPEGYVLGRVDADFFTWGTVMGAWFEPVADGKTRVTVVTKRRFPLSYSSDLPEDTFHERFAQAVSILGKGRPLPSAAPD
jgi:hypothetical protein